MEKYLILCLEEDTNTQLKEFLALNNMKLSSFIKMLVFDEIQSQENSQKDLK